MPTSALSGVIGGYVALLIAFFAFPWQKRLDRQNEIQKDVRRLCAELLRASAQHLEKLDGTKGRVTGEGRFVPESILFVLSEIKLLADRGTAERADAVVSLLAEISINPERSDVLEHVIRLKDAREDLINFVRRQNGLEELASPL